jgi:hypothetical protein
MAVPLATTSAAPPPPPRVWARLAEVRQWEPVAAKPFVSRGHGTGDWKTVVRVSSDLAEEYRRLPGQVSSEPGAVAAAFHTLPDGTPGPTFVMEKLPDGSWDYLAVDDSGTALSSSDGSLCQRCHTEAPSGALFGIPARFLLADEPSGEGGAAGAAAR